MSELTDEQREALAAYFRRRMNGVWSNEWEEQHRRKGLDPMRCNDSICLRAVEEADALSPVLAQMKREWQAEAIERVVRAIKAERGAGNDFRDVVLSRAAQIARAEASGREGERDWSRLHHGICPKCGEDKFIGHGPLCPDCYFASGQEST